MNLPPLSRTILSIWGNFWKFPSDGSPPRECRGGLQFSVCDPHLVRGHMARSVTCPNPHSTVYRLEIATQKTKDV